MKIKNKKLIIIVVATLVVIAGIILAYKYNYLFKPKATSNISEKPKQIQTTKYENFHLEIPKLSIEAPIVADVPGDDKDTYFKALEGGVAHFQGTKKPGEGGLIFIFGHSSFFPWAAGNYKEIFINLEKIEKNDEVSVWYNKKEYKYKVSETKVVSPEDISVLNPTSDEQLVLMTCVPPGTKEKRLIVIAKPI